MARATRFSSRAEGPADRMAGFIAHLRINGLNVGVAETGTALLALRAAGPGDPATLSLALRAVCTGCAEDHARFDDLFAAYWLNDGRARPRSDAGHEGAAARPRGRGTLPFLTGAVAGGAGRADQPDAADDGEADHGGKGRLIGSRVANLHRTDLREMLTPDQLAAAERVAEAIARAIRDRRSRRMRRGRGARLDLRRVVRATLATGGEPLRLFHKSRPDRPATIVALVDVSGSMTLYARVFLAFVKGLIGADLRTDAYLFHTRLVRITDALRDGDRLRAVNRLSLLAQGFGGGTRIGAALAAFNAGYARERVNGRSVVIILSDGYDTGAPAVIGQELARLKRRGARIVWLNPLAGWRDYAPVAGGMAAAMPHLDLFAPANTLAALAALEPEFSRL